MTNASKSKIFRRVGPVQALLFAGGVAGLLCAAVLGSATSAAEEPRRVPAARHDVAQAEGVQTAIFAGGCFWGVQGVFQHVKGVTNATSGYAGGAAETASYEMTETGTTGHAEAVKVTFDPRLITYGKLLQIFFSAAHDPTEIDRQGADVGTQYRSAIFPVNKEQATVAAEYIEQLDRGGVFANRIATKIETGKQFYDAEAYHQDFMFNNPTHPYIIAAEEPRVQALGSLFPEVFAVKPVLVADTRG
ncbi:peptide-methionine (S)-S-oxide reductase MsrA [Rhizobium sp. Root1220]|uniref:peptide-methionine (S)-S-oxide reductase MsrA n=1 Tax=Rhizobium sp. Root1220 TaxID=1736432 RepID=UPI0006F67E2D|nr:peptide-methionine (S)-S-oxide reductase MsrA [Rhizobium sp. Root1220]KQV68104.1 methionine sulfoxide reductase A [Rhizobium sp. Root1220]